MLLFLFYLPSFLLLTISTIPNTITTKPITIIAMPMNKVAVLAFNALTKGWKSLSAVYWVKFPLLFIEKTGNMND